MTLSAQLDLFGGSPATRSAAIHPAAVSAALRETAAALPSSLRLGTSSWSFPGWVGSVYRDPAEKSALARHGLGAYAAHPLLRTVGYDRSYYGPISVDQYRRCTECVPADFRFVVKAASQCTSPVIRDRYGRSTTRNPGFLDAHAAVDRIIGPYQEGLGIRAGVLLFQFPPLGNSLTREPRRFLDKLARFFEMLPHGPVYAVELRDRGLFVEAYGELLNALSLCHCYSVHPRAPSLGEQHRIIGHSARGPLVLRWMLHEGLQYEAARRRYRPFDRLIDEDPGTRRQIADLVLRQLATDQDAFVIINNKAEGSAPLSLFALAETVAGLRRNDSTFSAQTSDSNHARDNHAIDGAT